MDGWKMFHFLLGNPYFQGLLLLVSRNIFLLEIWKISSQQTVKLLDGETWKALRVESYIQLVVEIETNFQHLFPCRVIGFVFFSQNRGILHPKWMVKIMEHPMNMDYLRGFPIIFGNTHIIWPKRDNEESWLYHQSPLPHLHTQKDGFLLPAIWLLKVCAHNWTYQF